MKNISISRLWHHFIVALFAGSLCCPLAHAEIERLPQTSIRLSINLTSEPSNINSLQPRPDAPAPPEISVVEKRSTGNRSRRLRHFDYAPNMIVIVGLDASGEEVFRDIRPDPRFIRAEIPRRDRGWISRQVYLNNARFTFSVPNFAQLNTIWLYKPVWNGQRFEFAPLTSVSPR